MSKYNRKQKVAKVDDEFVSFWARAFQKVEPYLQRIGLVVVAGLVAWVGIFIAANYSSQGREKAAESFAKAARIYSADLLTADSPPPANADETPRFKTAKERAEATVKELDLLDKEHPGKLGQSAKLFRAGVLYDLLQLDDAAKLYAEVESAAKDTPVHALAAEGAGLCDEQRGKLDEALKRYKEMEPKTGDFYRDRALYNQGRVLIKKGDKKQALEAFKEAIAKVPTTPLKDEIQTQLMLLEGT